MADPKKVGQLDPATYKPNLQLAASDPDIPEGPTKESRRLALSELQPHIRDWDVTPTVVSVPFVLTNTELFQATQNPGLGTISINGGTLPAPTNAVPANAGTVKTNLTLANIPPTTAASIGLEMVSVPNLAGFFVVLMSWLPGHLTAEEANAIVTASIVESSNYEPSFTHISLSLGPVNQQTGIQAFLTDDITPVPVERSVQISGATRAVSLENGTSVFMMIGRNAGRLSVGMGDLGADDIAYDLHALDSLEDNPNADETMRLYITVLLHGGGDGGSYQPVTIRPFVNIQMPSYDLTDTTYLAESGTQENWDYLFPNGFADMVSDSVTQAVFPADVSVGQMYRTLVDTGYAYPYPPTPYGKQVTHRAKVLVEDITEDAESYTILLDDESNQALVDAVAAATAQVQILDAAVVNVEEGLLALEAEQVDKHLLTAERAGEIVVYVQPLGLGPDHDLPLNRRFLSFDNAYEYLITLPKYLRKRIVMDDRDYTTALTVSGLGVLDKTYALLANNIVLSTWKAFHGTPLVDPMSANSPSLRLRMTTDGFHFDHCEAIVYDGNNTALTPAFALAPVALVDTSSNIFMFRHGLTIGDWCAISFESGALDLSSGGNVRMGDNSVVMFAPYETAWTGALEIDAGNGSKVLMYGSVPTNPIAALVVFGVTDYPVIQHAEGWGPYIVRNSRTEARKPFAYHRESGEYIIPDSLSWYVPANLTSLRDNMFQWLSGATTSWTNQSPGRRRYLVSVRTELLTSEPGHDYTLQIYLAGPSTGYGEEPLDTRYCELPAWVGNNRDAGRVVELSAVIDAAFNDVVTFRVMDSSGVSTLYFQELTFKAVDLGMWG